MLANDLAADRHVLIGSNLQGMQGYIESLANARRWPHARPDTVEGHEADPLNSGAAALDAHSARGRIVHAFLRVLEASRNRLTPKISWPVR